MTHVDTGITGAKRQSWRHDNPRDMLKGIIAANPHAGKDELLQTFTQKMFEKGNKPVLETVIEYWFANNLQSLLNSDAQLKNQFSKSQAVKQIKNQIRERIKIAAGVVLMDMLMPNKKRLRECTGADCAAVGGWLSIIAARMPASAIVGKVFSEQDVRALLEEEARKK